MSFPFTSMTGGVSLTTNYAGNASMGAGRASGDVYKRQMIQRTGALIFDETADRYDIRFDVNDYYGGLHCGDCMEVFVRGKWKPTRMEYGDNWYLVGIRAADLSGLRVRI